MLTMNWDVLWNTKGGKNDPASGSLTWGISDGVTIDGGDVTFDTSMTFEYGAVSFARDGTGLVVREDPEDAAEDFYDSATRVTGDLDYT